METNSGSLFDALHFHDYALAALAVKFGVRDGLSGVQVEFAFGEGQGGFVMEKQIPSGNDSQKGNGKSERGNGKSQKSSGNRKTAARASFANEV